MALIYPFLVIDEGIKTNVLGKDIFFRFILPHVLKENHSSKKVTILKDINEKGIYKIERSLSSLKVEICSNPLTAFWHRYIVQSFCEKDSNEKYTKDRTMLTIPSSQNEWTDSVIEVPNKIIINDIFTPFVVSSNTHITDVLIIEVLTDSPSLIIKENINCGNFLNKDIFNF